jgi:hypothetical protein
MPHRPPQSPTAHRPPPASPKAPVGAEGLYGYYASSWAVCETDDAFPRHGEPASFVETRIRNYSLLDFKPQVGGWADVVWWARRALGAQEIRMGSRCAMHRCEN